MAGKIRAKLIMELREQAASRRAIASSRRMPMGSVCEAFGIAAERGITRDRIKDMPEDEVYRLLYSDKRRHESVLAEPDWGRIREEMARVGVNLRLPRDEYETECRSRCDVAMGCTRFCEGHGDRVAANSLAKRIEHKAGASCEADRSGPTVGRGLADPATGEASKMYLFVGVLPFGQKAYFEPTLDMKERARLRCHVRMCGFFGGMPERTVRGSCKTAVAKHPREGEIVLNDACEALGERCTTAIVSAQVRKPKQKAPAEGAAKDAATWAIAKLRNRVFPGFGEVAAAARGCSSEY